MDGKISPEKKNSARKKKIQTGKKKYKYFEFVFPGVKKSKSKFTKKNNDEHAMADYCIYRFYQPLSMLVNATGKSR